MMKEEICQTEILEKCIDLKKSCLSEKKEIMDMLYKYKDSFNLRDEIGSCPDIEVEIDVTDNLHFLLEHIVLKKKIKLN